MWATINERYIFWNATTAYSHAHKCTVDSLPRCQLDYFFSPHLLQQLEFDSAKRSIVDARPWRHLRARSAEHLALINRMRWKQLQNKRNEYRQKSIIPHNLQWCLRFAQLKFDRQLVQALTLIQIKWASCFRPETPVGILPHDWDRRRMTHFVLLHHYWLFH